MSAFVGSTTAWIRGAALACLSLPGLAGVYGSDARVIAIHLEDDHSGSFHFFAETLDLEEPHALLLIDSHSDASAVPRSDEIRRGLREVHHPAERVERLKQWRRNGRVQVFDWIEPLMPCPFDSVWWLAPPSGGGNASRHGAEREAREQLDARIAFETREAGSLGERFHCFGGLDAFEQELPDGVPLVVSLDLDYFMEVDVGAIPAAFESLWQRVLRLPNLRAISIAVSRPWLRDDAQAEALVIAALGSALAVRNATVRLEPFAPRGPDRSELAKGLVELGEQPERFDFATASPALRELLVTHAGRFDVGFETERWTSLIEGWRGEAEGWGIAVDDHQPEVDRVWRIGWEAAHGATPPSLRLASARGEPPPREVQWLWRRPDADAYDLLPDSGLGKRFAADAPAVVSTVDVELAVTRDGALSAEVWRTALDAATGFGSVDLVARYRDGDSWGQTPLVTVRVVDSRLGAFRAALSEQFQLPYVFGVGLLRADDRTGPDTGIGSDCANFLVYAWRRMGLRLPWCDPGQLRARLELLGEASSLDESERLPIDPRDVDAGLVIDCGSHVAAVWQDRDPVGILDPGDLVAHHLGGQPEIITLEALLAERPHDGFALRRWPITAVSARLRVGGDVVIDGDELILPGEQGGDKVDLCLANLEMALTPRREPARQKPFLFRADPEVAESLVATGMTAVSLANNHSGDFGAEGLADTMAALEAAGVGHFGTLRRDSAAGEWPEPEPWLGRCGPVSLAVFGVNLIEASEGDGAEEGALVRIVELPSDRDFLAAAINRAKRGGHTVLVMPHWGAEYRGDTDESQRHWARWLVDQGVDLIVGAHSHHVQPLQFHRARPVFFSVGNLHFAGRDGPPGFQEPWWAQIEFDDRGRMIRTRLLPAGSPTRDPAPSGPDR